MGRGLAVLIAIACGACGRIGFDVVADDGTDAASAHDEDADGVADVEDMCPHLAGSQIDTDGDRVGDDCDPEPNNPRQSVLVFATMEREAPQRFTLDAGDWTLQADAVRFSGMGPGGRLVLAQPVADYRMVVGVDILAITAGPAFQKQFGLGAMGPAADQYFIELNELPGISQAAVTATDGTSFNSIATRSLPSGVHLGRVDLEATQLASSGTMTMDGGWSGETYPLTASTPLYMGGTVLQVFSNGLQFDLRYLWIVGW